MNSPNKLHPLLEQLKWKKTRKNCLEEMIEGIIRSKSPHYSDIADYSSSDIKQDSKIKRVYRLLKDQEFEGALIADAISKLCPPGKWLLALDRTNWQRGEHSINILALCVVVDNTSIPIYVHMLEKDGCSNSSERIAIIKDFIAQYGVEKIDCLLADREFWDEEFIKYLSESEVPFAIRIKSNMQLKHSNGGEMSCANMLKQSSKVRTSWRGKKITVYGKSGKNLFVATNLQNRNALKLYKRRWAIEKCFNAMKSQGFYLERTGIVKVDRLRKLVLVYAIAIALLVKLGELMNDRGMIKSVKKTGYKMYSLFKAGMKAFTSYVQKRTSEYRRIFRAFDAFINSFV